jgi:hypothetical protein
VEALMKHLGPEKLAKLGIKDAAGLKEYLKSAGSQTELLGELGTSGAFEFKGDTLSLMDAASTEKGQTMLEDRAKENLLRKSGAESAGFKSEEYKKKDGESDVDFEKRKSEGIAAGEKRFKSMLIAQINKGSRTAFDGGKGSWSKTDDVLKKVMEGDKDATSLYDSWVNAGALDSYSSRTNLKASLGNAEAELNKIKKGGAKGKNMDEESFAKYVDGREAKLGELRDQLLDKDATVMASNATINANGPVTINTKEPA